MVEYKCKQCNKIYYNKYDYNRHLNRKNPCKSNQEIDTKIYQNIPTVPISYQNLPNNTKINNNLPENINIPKEICKNQCQHCKKNFSQISSLNRHIKDRCKVLNQQDNEKENLLQKLVEQMVYFGI